jgi:ATP-binding cassette subfamily B protein IrtB
MIQKLLFLSDEGYIGLKKAVAACVLTNFSIMAAFGIMINIINEIIKPYIYNEGETDLRKIMLYFSAGVVLAVLQGFIYINEYNKTYFNAYNESEGTRLGIAEHIRKLPLSFFNRKNLSEITVNMMEDCTRIETALSHVIPQLAGNIISATLVCIMLSFYDWRMAAAVYITLPLTALFIILTKKIQIKFGEKHVKAKLRVSDQVHEYIDGIKVIKAFNLGGERFESLDKAMHNFMKESIIFEGITGTIVTTATVFLQTGIGIAVFTGTTLLLQGELQVISYILFVLISVKIYSPLVVTLTLSAALNYFRVATKRMQMLRNEKEMLGNNSINIENFDFKLENVSFAYNEEEVISNFSAHIRQGNVTALVGPSGSGKSTISHLLARFWDVSGGRITLGDTDIREIEPEKLMTYMSFVFQDVVLFNDTVYNNIKIGNMNATKEEVTEAAKKARCHDFIMEMPKGYDTVIGENGSTLSGGERQRISIARAVLKNAPIILLDEATSSLDPENEVEIQTALSELVKGKTVVVIAHRLRTIVNADQILVLKDGKLAESGNHAELTEKNGLYKQLYQIQQDSLGWKFR